MSKWLFRSGDGNEGNFPRYIVELGAKDCPYAALRVLVANMYIAGRAARRHIIATVEVDGEAEYGIHATVSEGPRGQHAFGAAWLTAELQPVEDDEDAGLLCYELRKLLDGAALRQYRAELKRKGA